MPQALVCKILDFPAAHRNLHHGGHCKQLHGHTWSLEIKCKGHIIDDQDNPAFGMVVDFQTIKDVYKKYVEPFVEHQYLNETIDLPEYTTEHLAYWVFQQMRPHLPLHSIRLWEGKTSYAEINGGDQLRT